MLTDAQVRAILNGMREEGFEEREETMDDDGPDCLEAREIVEERRREH